MSLPSSWAEETCLVKQQLYPEPSKPAPGSGRSLCDLLFMSAPCWWWPLLVLLFAFHLKGVISFWPSGSRRVFCLSWLGKGKKPLNGMSLEDDPPRTTDSSPTCLWTWSLHLLLSQTIVHIHSYTLLSLWVCKTRFLISSQVAWFYFICKMEVAGSNLPWIEACRLTAEKRAFKPMGLVRIQMPPFFLLRGYM